MPALAGFPESERKMAEQALRPEDGARFYGKIQEIDDGFRASCIVRNDLGSECRQGRLMTRLSLTEGEARAWIKSVAENLGFRTWINESPSER
jgi:hypothetical protein